MRILTLFKVAIVLVLCLVVVGFYQGWFVLASRGIDDEGGQIEVNLTVDPEKALDDARAIGTQARDLTADPDDATSDDADPDDADPDDADPDDATSDDATSDDDGVPDDGAKADFPSEVSEADVPSATPANDRPAESLEDVVEPETE